MRLVFDRTAPAGAALVVVVGCGTRSRFGPDGGDDAAVATGGVTGQDAGATGGTPGSGRSTGSGDGTGGTSVDGSGRRRHQR